MVFGFDRSQSPWDQADDAIEKLLEAARSLYAIVEPPPSQMGLIGAGRIGGRSDSLRQAIDKSTQTLITCANLEADKKMKTQHVSSIVDRIEQNLFFLLDGLDRVSTLYHGRFLELGMGLTSIVSIALGWIESSTKEWLVTIERVNKSKDLEGRIADLSTTLLTAESKAIAVYKV